MIRRGKIFSLIPAVTISYIIDRRNYRKFIQIFLNSFWEKIVWHRANLQQRVQPALGIRVPHFANFSRVHLGPSMVLFYRHASRNLPRSSHRVSKGMWSDRPSGAALSVALFLGFREDLAARNAGCSAVFYASTHSSGYLTYFIWYIKMMLFETCVLVD